MIKKIISLVALTVLAISLSGCSSSKETISTDKAPSTIEDQTVQTSYDYTNKEKGFSTTLPTSRTFQENAFGSLVVFFAPQAEGDTIKENIGVVTTKLTGDIDLQNFYESAKKNLENTINNFQIIQEENLTINKGPAIKMIYKGTEGQSKLQRQQVILLKGSTIFIFTYTATQDTFSQLINDINSIINSFRI